MSSVQPYAAAHSVFCEVLQFNWFYSGEIHVLSFTRRLTENSNEYI